jgi:hypothetical protein
MTALCSVPLSLLNTLGRISCLWRAATTSLASLANPDLPLPLSPYITVIPSSPNVRLLSVVSALIFTRSRISSSSTFEPVDDDTGRLVAVSG